MERACPSCPPAPTYMPIPRQYFRHGKTAALFQVVSPGDFFTANSYRILSAPTVGAAEVARYLYTFFFSLSSLYKRSSIIWRIIGEHVNRGAWQHHDAMGRRDMRLFPVVTEMIYGFLAR